MVYAYGRGGVGEAAMAALVQLTPAALVAPVAAVAGDRFPRVRVLAGSFLAQAVAAAAVATAMLGDAPAGVVYAAATLLAVTITFSRPAMSSLLPGVTTTPTELTAANVVGGLIENVGRFAGPLLAGLIIHVAEPGTVFAAAAAMMTAATALVATVPATSAPADGADGEEETPRRALIGGFTVLRSEPGPRLLVALLGVVNVVVGALDVLFVAVAVDLLEREEAVSGLLSGAAGLGGIAGAAVAVGLVGRRRLTPPIVAGSVLLGAPVVVLGGTNGLLMAMALLLVAGVGRTVVGIGCRTLLQGVTPDDVLARVFGVHEGLTMAAYAIGSVAVAALDGWLGLSATLVVLGLLVPIVVLLRLGALLALDARRPEPDPEVVNLMRSVPMFAPLPPYSLEQLAVNFERHTYRPGESLMTVGTPGDALYVIASGEAIVERDGATVHRCRAGDHVGEVALLRDVPRTADVVAGDDLVAYRLERDVFLEAVTGHPLSLIHI